MKKIILVLLSCALANASVVELTLDYDINISNFYRKNGETKILSDTRHNELLSVGKLDSIYNGASILNFDPSISKFSLAGYYRHDNYAKGFENWTYLDMYGTLTIGSSAQYPVGSVVPIEVSYEYVDRFSETQYTSSGLGIWEGYYSIEHYSVSGKTVRLDEINLIAGQQYDFYVWFQAGSSFVPITEMFLSGISFNFESIPEPMTIALLGLGCCFVKRTKQGQTKFF